MSGKIILNLAISLDGFIADKDGGYGWIQPSGDAALNTSAAWSHEDFLARVSCVVMGKTSYDQGLHADLGHKPVYVVTSQKLADHGNVHFIGGDIRQKVEELKRQSAGDVYLFGGGVSIHPLLAAGLVDEYVIGVIPVILGDGIPLFLHGHPPLPLHLTHTYVEDGIVILRYVPRDKKNPA